jgi:hypothetical protein
VLTKETQVYRRVCGKGYYHYETIEVHVYQNSTYGFDSDSTMIIYGYIYKDAFDPLDPENNLLTQSNWSSCGYHFQLAAYLQINKTYMLVVTTFDPNIQGSFTVFVTGPYNISLSRISKYQYFTKQVKTHKQNRFVKSAPTIV